MFRLFFQELRFRRNAIIGWGLGLSIFPILYVGLYPSFADQMATFQEMMDIALYQALGISMYSFESYIASTVTNLVPLILSIFAVTNATGTLAGEEDHGRLELIAALPIPRWQIVVVKSAAVGIALLLILSVVGVSGALTILAIADQVDMTVTAWDVFLNLLASWPLVMSFAMVSLFLGVLAPNRRTAATIATFLVIASYLGNNLVGMVSSLEQIQFLFPFHYYDATAQGFVDGQQLGDVMVLLGIAVFSLILAVFAFGWRRITVGSWAWQRGRVSDQ